MEIVMAVSQNQRLRKAAAKAAKRKAVVADKLARERRELTISKPRHIDFAASPIVACQMTSGLEARGMGTLTVVRKLTLGRYGLAVFLLDTWCLGVKDAFFRVVNSEQYETYSERSQAVGEAEQIDPARARRLVRDAVAYGASNGFPPPASVAEIEPIFGDVAPAGEPFVFGKDGKPHFVAGPSDSQSRFRHVLKVLEQRFGADGFNVTMGLEDNLDDEDDFDEDPSDGEAFEREMIPGGAETDDTEEASDQSQAA
jgi:hypothetical protein